MKQDPANSAEEPSWHLLRPSGTLRGASSILIAQSNASLFSCHSNSDPLEKEVRVCYSPSTVQTETLGGTTQKLLQTCWDPTLGPTEIRHLTGIMVKLFNVKRKTILTLFCF